MSTISETCACGSQFEYVGLAPTSAIYDFRKAHADCRATASCRSCALCERELSAVRLELQAVVRERDQYRDALEQIADDIHPPRGRETATTVEMRRVARAALSRERKDTT